jgi:hypothetical protein
MAIKPRSPYAPKSKAVNSNEIASPVLSTPPDDSSEINKPKHGWAALHGKLIGAIFFAAVQLGAPFAPVANAAAVTASQVQTVQSDTDPLNAVSRTEPTADPPSSGSRTPPLFVTTYGSGAIAPVQSVGAAPTAVTVAITFSPGHRDEAEEIIKQLDSIHPEHHSVWYSLGSTFSANILPAVFTSLVGPAILEYLRKRKELKEKKAARITLTMNGIIMQADSPEDLEKGLKMIETLKARKAKRQPG